MTRYGEIARLINGLEIPQESLQTHTGIYFPLRGESRDVSAVPVKSVCVLVYPFAHGAAGAVGARLSLRPRFRERADEIAELGQIVSRE